MVCKTTIPTVSHFLSIIEADIPEWPVRMVVRTLRMLCEGCKQKMEKVDEENLYQRFVEVFCETKNHIHELALETAGSNAGRLCSTILEGICMVDTDESTLSANNGDHAKVIEDFLVMYRTLHDGMVTLASDDEFIVCMGPNGRQGLLDIASVFTFVIESGEEAVSEIRARS